MKSHPRLGFSSRPHALAAPKNPLCAIKNLRRARRAAVCLTLTLLAAIPLRTLAQLPSGAQVVSGAASFSTAPGALTITQTTDRAIINWQDFSLAAGATSRFVQPDAASATLNRVVSGLPTTLAGSLQANGHIYLINPNGILIGAGARIDTAGFLASTLDVPNQEFLAGGDLHFSGDSAAAIMNLGSINALGGDVFLIALQVQNAGNITADRGTIGLAAGSEILLTTGGNERQFIRAASLPGALVNSGTISAASAELKAAGGNAYALAINNSGTVRATGSAVRDGQIWLVASGESTVSNSGTLDTSSLTGLGGKIAVTGGRVLLDTDSRLIATGATGGGEILVGGGWQGNDAAIANASAVVMKPGATIDVSTTAAGNGGTAVLWSQDYTSFHGSIAATGGPSRGSGGHVETSSQGNLQVFGSVDASAPSGAAGTWLLDPLNVTIAATGANGTLFANPFVPAADSVILASSVATALNGGNNVSITTGTTGASAGDINVNAPITWTTNNTLTLSARNDVRVNFDLTATGATAGVVITPNANGGSNGSFSLNNRASLTLSGATPSLTIAGQAYTIINSLGVQGDATTAPATPTLQGLAATANLGGRYALGSNIDATTTSTWNSNLGFTPIGIGGQAFAGTFDGLGHSISGLSITRPAANNVGLFGYLTGNVRRVGLLDAFVVGKTSIGGLVGYNAGGNIFTSYVGGTVGGSGHIVVGSRVGGLVGTNTGKIEASYASANVSGVANVGGLVGFNGENVSGGYNGFNITTQGWISTSYSTGNVSGQTSVGGLVGASDAYFSSESISTLQDVYATGSVSGTTNVGGLVGYNRDTNLTRGYATGSVSGTTNVGGLAGNNERSKPSPNGITSSYWNLTTTGQTAAVGLENGLTQYSFGRTTAEMQQMASFPDFNITNVGGTNGAIWRIYEGSTTPWLTTFLFPVTVTANSDTKTYNAVAYSGGNGATVSLPTVNPALSGTLAFGGTAQGAVNFGTNYMIVPSGQYSVQQGYDIIYAPGTLTINRANLTVSGTRVYDGTTIFTGSNLTATGVAGQTFTVTGAGLTGNLGTKNVQTNQSLASLNGLSLGTSTNGGLVNNYNPVFQATSSVSVTPANLVLSGARVYDGTTIFPGTALTATGVSGETFSVTGSGAAGNLSTRNVQTNQSLVSVSGLTLGTSGNGGVAGNYAAPSFIGSSVSVTPAVLTLSGTRAYDGTTAFAGSNLTANGVNGETFSVTGAGLTGNLATKNVQTNQLLASVGGLTLGTSTNGGAAGNYSALSTTGSSVSVTRVNLAVTTSDVVKTYDGTTSATGNPVILSGQLFGSDALGYGAFGPGYAYVGKDVGIGNKTVTLTGINVNDGNSGANYALTLVNNTTSTINPAPLTLTANTTTKSYGQTVSFAGTEFTSNGLKNGETVGSVTLTSTGAVATATVAGSPYSILPSAATGGTFSASNYTVSYVSGSLSLSLGTLTITANNASKTYGQTTTFAGTEFTSVGLQNGETVGSVTLTSSGAVATAGVAGSPYSITAFGATGGTFDPLNYRIGYAPGSLTISPASLTYVANTASRLVGAAEPPFSGTVTGFVNSETLAGATTGALTFGTNATIASPVGLYQILGSGLTANNGNYTFVQASPNYVALNIGNLTSLVITAADKTKIYGAALPTFTATYAGFVNGDTAANVTGLQFNTTATTGSNVGTYTITPFGATAPNNYTVGYVPGTLTINPAALTLTAISTSRIYGAANPTFDATYTGLVNGDASTVVTGLQLTTPATVTSNVGNYAITPTGATASNYTITQVPGTLTIDPKDIVVTATGGTSVYGSSPTSPGFTATGLVNGQTASVLTGLANNFAITNTTNANSYTLSVTGTLINGNYNITTRNDGTWVVTPKDVVVTATGGTSIYGASPTNPGFTATGLVNGQTASALTGLANNFAVTNNTNAGSYTLSVTGTLTNGNYNVTTRNDGTWGVSPRNLIVTANNGTKIYGQTTTFAGTEFTSSGLQNSQTIGTVTLASSGAAATAGVTGSPYSLIPSAAAGGTFNPVNYTLSYVAGGLTVTPAALTITANNATKIYGQTKTFAGTEFVPSGLQNSETIGSVTLASAGTVATAGVGSSPYSLIASAATGGTFNPANYSLNYVAGSLAVTPAALTITASNATKVYGQTKTFAGTEFTSTGLLNSDTIGSVTLTSAGTVATAGVGSSPYSLAASAATGGTFTGTNYVISYVPGALTITPAVLTYVATSTSRLVGAANPAFSGTVTGFANSETIASATTGSLSFGTTATIASQVGVYAINGSGLAANNGNYSFIQAPPNATAFTINALSQSPTPLTITADNKTKTYAAPLPTFTATYAGFISSDTAANVTGLQFNTAATIGSNVGTYTITPFGATAPSYYTLGYVPGTLTINPAALSITANNASRLYGSANPAFTATYAGLVNGDTSTVVSGLQITTPATTASNVGTYAITPSAATAPNYTLTFLPGSLTINPATLTYVATPASRLVSAPNPAFGGTVTGFVNGDTQPTATTGSLAFGTTAISSSPVGVYPITGSGLTANGGNYTFVQAPPNFIAFTINPVAQSVLTPLTIAADNKTKLYGASLPTFTASYTGFINSDTASSVTGLQFSTTATASSNVGTFTITPFGATAPNYYTVGYVPGILTINPASLSITANSTARVYGSANPAFSASYAGFVDGDTSAIVSGLQITTPATTSSNVGSYAITPSAATAPNYALTFLPGTLTINPASLTLTAANATRDFGAPNPAFTGTFSGFVNGDTASVVSGLAFNTPATTTSPAGAYPIVPSGAKAANYTLAFVNGTLAVATPSIVIGGTPLPVTTVNQQPAITSTLAVIKVGDRLTLLPLAGADSSGSLDGKLAVTLAQATNIPRFELSTTASSSRTNLVSSAPGRPNFGGFELIPALAGRGPGGGTSNDAGKFGAAELNEPGLYRESSVNMGGFNVIYHEPVAEARQQAQSNTALGSSYREFSEEDHPQLNIVRAKTERKPAGAAAGGSAGGAL
jgi:filamentous hemagglutinin family protein